MENNNIVDLFDVLKGILKRIKANKLRYFTMFFAVSIISFYLIGEKYYSTKIILKSPLPAYVLSDFINDLNNLIKKNKSTELSELSGVSSQTISEVKNISSSIYNKGEFNYFLIKFSTYNLNVIDSVPKIIMNIIKNDSFFKEEFNTRMKIKRDYLDAINNEMRYIETLKNKGKVNSEYNYQPSLELSKERVTLSSQIKNEQIISLVMTYRNINTKNNKVTKILNSLFIGIFSCFILLFIIEIIAIIKAH